MATAEIRTGKVARHDRPPRIFLGIGAGMLALNHLSIALGVGLQPEALFLGVWLVQMGGWSGFAGRTFDAVWAWVNPSGRRTIAFVLLSFVVTLGVAEGIAWFAYGQHL